MQSILDFLKGIGDLLVSAFQIVMDFFGDVVYVIQLTGKFFAQIPEYFSWLPAEILTVVILIFTVVVLYKVLGREG